MGRSRRHARHPRDRARERARAVTRAQDYADLPWWLAEDYPELFHHPAQFDRIRLYSIAWDVREILAYPPQMPFRQVHRCHPYNRLVELLRGVSYLDRMNGSVNIDLGPTG